MEEIPQDWMTLFPKSTIQNIEKITSNVLACFDNIDVLNIENTPDNKINDFLKKLDFVHYQNTGCEDSIGNDYDYKKKTIINFIKKVKFYFMEKENFESDKDLEILKDKVMVEVCSKIVNIILLESKE